ncbi:MAG: reverse transcriptase family protein, partial [Cyanobacteria bacterium J06649_11]
TRVTDSTRSLIDHVLVLDCSNILQEHMIHVFLIICCYETQTTTEIYKDIDWAKVQAEVLETPWWITSTFDDIDDSYWAWKSLYNQIISNYVTERKVKIRAEIHPWMNSDIRKHMNHRYKLLLLAQKTNKGSLQWSLYKQARNKCTTLLRKAKSDYWKNKFDNSTSAKEFWSLVKSFNGQQTKSKIGPIKNNCGNILTCDLEKSNALNKYFATIGKRMSEHLPPPHPIEFNNTVPQCSPVIKIDRSDLSKQFKKLAHPSKASGIDNISARDLHSIGEPIIDSLMTIFKKSIGTLKIPSVWKKSKVKCLHKKGSKLECENYRPISLLSILSKSKSIICSNLDYHLQTHNLLNESQWGFRKQRSTILALLNMTEKWRHLLDNNHHVGILFLDYRKAFDSVNHEIIDHKLLKYGINGDLHKWIMNYLSDRSQITIVNGKLSDTEPIDTGVPQGSLIGPRAFTLTVNDCPDISEDFDTDLFADDNTSACSDKNLDTMFVKIQHMANELSSWSSTTHLSVHPLKSTLLVLSPKAFIGPLPLVSLDGVPLPIKKNAKCLGVKIDNKLSWKDHISSTTKLFGVKIKTYALPIWGNGCKIN